MDRFKKVPVREQDPQVRNKNFQEVSLGYNKEEAQKEALRCLQCKSPACVQGCPVSIDIPGFISHLAKGNEEEAAKALWKYTSLPAVCGRVCPQETQCEQRCILAKRGESVSIGKLERYAADVARENNLFPTFTKEKRQEKIAIIGAGPAGISCATGLLQQGYQVTIFEALHKPGGVLVYGIPEFRLPDEVVFHEIDSLLKNGAILETDVIIGRTLTIDELFKEGYEAVFIGSGAGLPKFMGIPGENLNGVYSANEFLTRANLMKAYDKNHDTPINAGKKTAVIGGGNVAMDAARVAKRLGSQVTVVYRRTKNELPAREEEIHHAMEEGIEFHFLTNPVEILGKDKSRATHLKCVKMELGEPDESGRRRPIEIPNSEILLEADTVIMALGTDPNPLISMTTPGLEINRRNCIVTNEKGATTVEGIYAGGDAVTGSATVILAMGAGKEAAQAIHEYLQKKEYK